MMSMVGTFRIQSLSPFAQMLVYYMARADMMHPGMGGGNDHENSSERLYYSSVVHHRTVILCICHPSTSPRRET